MRGGNRPWFPMELLMVCDLQRVQKEQESVQNQAIMIRVCSFICNPHQMSSFAVLCCTPGEEIQPDGCNEEGDRTRARQQDAAQRRNQAG